MAEHSRTERVGLVVLAAAALVVTLVASPLLAKGLEEMRKDGSVGERYDGYLVVRSSDAPAEVKQAVEEINAKRRAIYEKRAGEEGVPVEQVGRVYAKQIYDEAPAGTWFLGESKEWVRKP